MSKRTNEIWDEALKLHHYNINNPKINKDDDKYDERMILLVSQKSNWHIYYDPKYHSILSIAVVPDAKSSGFGDIAYFRRWYKYKKRNSYKTMLCLSDKAIKIINKEYD